MRHICFSESPAKRGESAFRKYFPWFWLIAAYSFMVLFLILYGRSVLDSDMASEMILASKLNEEGGILSRSWYYSTELRVFCEQLLFKLGLTVFPSDWHAARTLAQAILMALLALSFLYFGFSTGLRTSIVYCAAAMMCPFGFWYMFHGSIGGFYFIHMLFVTTSLGLLCHLVTDENHRALPLRLFLLGMVSLMAGMNGVRILMNLYSPLVLAALAVYLIHLHETGKFEFIKCSEGKTVIFSFYTFFCALCGDLINSKILAPLYHFPVPKPFWRRLSLSRLLSAWSDFLSLFGYQSDRYFEVQVPLFSLGGLLNFFGLLLPAALLLALLRLCLHWKRLNFMPRLMTALLLSCLLVDGVVFAMLNDESAINASYWLPVIPVCFVVLAQAGHTEQFRFPLTRRLLAAAFTVTILGTSTATLHQFVTEPPRAPKGIQQVCAWLQENGYTQGYATFWYSNVLTELSNGQIEMWTAADLSTLQTTQWLQSTSHDVPPQNGPVFILALAGELSQLPYYSDSAIVYRDDYGYTILAYDSAETVLHLISQQTASSS
ncbi:MAG: hypothetical protein Q4C60_01975 [Eubacteriales bacterium]|nr:hypothetical protein [Eubacteriales bacterium]